MVIDKNLYSEINEYCKENNIKTRDFIHKILKEAFLKEKYGDSPFAFLKKEEKNTQQEIQPITQVENTVIKPVIEQVVVENVIEVEKPMVIETEKTTEEPIIVKKKRKLR
jgi:hypothetical protein